MKYYDKEGGKILLLIKNSIVYSSKVNLMYLLERFWERDKNWVDCFGEVPMGICYGYKKLGIKPCNQPHPIEMDNFLKKQPPVFDLQATIEYANHNIVFWC